MIVSFLTYSQSVMTIRLPAGSWFEVFKRSMITICPLDCQCYVLVRHMNSVIIFLPAAKVVDVGLKCMNDCSILKYFSQFCTFLSCKFFVL